MVTAAAGGVGQVLVQWLKAAGATVLAVVGSEEKAATVRALGADQVLCSAKEDVAARVKALTGVVPLPHPVAPRGSRPAPIRCMS